MDTTLTASDTIELKNLAYFVTYSIIIPTNPVTFTASSIGSTRKLTFSDTTLTTVNGNTACGDLIAADSLLDLLSKSILSGNIIYLQILIYIYNQYTFETIEL